MTTDNVFVNNTYATKTTNEFGVTMAKKIWGDSGRNVANNIGATSIILNEYSYMLAIAQGHQSIVNIANAFGWSNRKLIDSGLLNIDPQILNIVPKYINKVQAKIDLVEYDISLTAIDELSKSEKRKKEEDIRTYYEVAPTLKAIGIDPNIIFEDLDTDNMPDVPDELYFNMATDYKTKKEIEYELKLVEFFNFNNWQQIKKDLSFDWAVFGPGMLYFYTDHLGNKKVKRIDPAYQVLPFDISETFDNLTACGHVEFISTQQFISETQNEFTKTEQDSYIEQYATNHSIGMYGIYPQNYSQFSMATKYMPVLRFQFLSNDDVETIEFTNVFGNIKAYDLKDGIGAKTARDINEGKKKLNRFTLMNKYGGTFILGSEKCYGYGRLPSFRDPDYPVDDVLDYVIISPNMRMGRNVSMVSQIIEPLNMMNTAWNRIKDIFAKGYNGFLDINFSKITKIEFGKAGQNFNEKDVLDLLLSKQILISQDKLNQYDQSTGQSANFIANGLSINDYLAAFQLAKDMIEQITGVNEVSMSPEALKGVEQLRQQSTNEALGYIYHAYNQIYKGVAKRYLLSLQADEQEGYPLCKWQIGMDRRPTQQEWAELYASIDRAVGNGLLNESDKIAIRRINNLKLAEQMFVIREAKRTRQLQQQEQDRIAQTAEVNKQAAQVATEEQLKIIEAEKQKIKLEKDLELRNLLAVQQSKNEGAVDAKLIEVQGKVDAVYQAGTDSIIKEHIKNQKEESKNDK